MQFRDLPCEICLLKAPVAESEYRRYWTSCFQSAARRRSSMAGCPMSPMHPDIWQRALLCLIHPCHSAENFTIHVRMPRETCHRVPPHLPCLKYGVLCIFVRFGRSGRLRSRRSKGPVILERSARSIRPRTGLKKDIAGIADFGMWIHSRTCCAPHVCASVKPAGWSVSRNKSFFLT